MIAPDHAVRLRLCSELNVRKPIKEAFLLFTPMGEKDWSPGWNPVFIWPLSGDLSLETVFLTRSEGRETLWVVSRLDLERHLVEYLRVTPGFHTARVMVKCRPSGEHSTLAEIGYDYTALSTGGMEFLSSLSGAAFNKMIKEWEIQIESFLFRGNKDAH